VRANSRSGRGRSRTTQPLRAAAGKIDEYLQWLLVPYRLLTALVVFVGALGAIADIYYAAPKVAPSYVDPGNPFHNPFIVSNEQTLLTFYHVQIDGGATVPQAFSEPTGILGYPMATWSDKELATPLEPTAHHEYWVLFFANQSIPNPALIQQASLRLDIHYKIRLLPYLYWSREKVYGFSLMGAMAGSGGIWFPDDEVIDNKSLVFTPDTGEPMKVPFPPGDMSFKRPASQ
jgi:hypothetical protein